jgi:hypothetical protein
MITKHREAPSPMYPMTKFEKFCLQKEMRAFDLVENRLDEARLEELLNLQDAVHGLTLEHLQNLVLERMDRGDLTVEAIEKAWERQCFAGFGDPAEVRRIIDEALVDLEVGPFHQWEDVPF